MTLRTERVFVTPEMAQRWLESTPHSRALNPERIARYASDIAADAWLENGQTVSICSCHGALANGHHRMHGVVRAGKGVWILLVHGVEPNAIKTQDTGLAKRASDWSDRENAGPGYSIVNTLARFITNSQKAITERVRDQLWSLLGDDHLQFAIRSTVGDRIARGVPTRLGIALVHRVNEERGIIMADRITKHLGPEGSPEHAYLRARSNQPSLSTQICTRIAIRMAMAAVRDERVSLLRPPGVTEAIRILKLAEVARALGVEGDS